VIGGQSHSALSRPEDNRERTIGRREASHHLPNRVSLDTAPQAKARAERLRRSIPIPKQSGLLAVEAVTSEPVSAGKVSLLRGKVQGISADSAAGTGSGSVFWTINQAVATKFPKQKNREFSRQNSEFFQRIREGSISMGNTPARACTPKSFLPPKR